MASGAAGGRPGGTTQPGAPPPPPPDEWIARTARKPEPPGGPPRGGRPPAPVRHDEVNACTVSNAGQSDRPRTTRRRCRPPAKPRSRVPGAGAEPPRTGYGRRDGSTPPAAPPAQVVLHRRA